MAWFTRACMRINLRYFHSSHTLVGKPDLLSRPFRKVQAPAVNKGTSIIDANLHRAARVRVGYLDCRAHRQIARRGRQVVGIVGLATGNWLTSSPGALVRGLDHFDGFARIRTTS